ncbi:glycosyl hydrolase [Pontiellaceae bacterium B12227]|nr:glycosyl hydrolase [Pontiellaceae bacterium B12227]
MKLTLYLFFALTCTAQASTVESDFEKPPREIRPETWFHLIGGNVNKEFLTTDLEAVKDAGFKGLHLFHGRGRAWPGVEPQIQTLSPQWDNLIEHVADETGRLDLKFTMQNCPGWAMSGGPWIKPEDAMRHLIWSRTDIQGGTKQPIQLPIPMPSKEEWRNYQDVAVLAFPTPANDTAAPLIPTKIKSNLDDAPWNDLFSKDGKPKIQIPVTRRDRTWLEVTFGQETVLRTIEVPPTEHLMKRRSFDTDTVIRLQGHDSNGWKDIGSRVIPRGNWQDRLPEHGIFLAFPDFKSNRFRIVFENNFPVELTYLRLYDGARLNDWRGQAGYVLRSLERAKPPQQDPASHIPIKDVIDLSGKMTADGTLNWNAPKGHWTIVRYGHVNTGVKNKPAPPEATGFECNKLSKRGADTHFAGYIGRLSQPGGPADSERLKGMLIDSWECYTQTWTEEMEQEFEARRGYPLRTMLPAISGWVMNDIQTSERFLRDWRDTINDLLVDNYFGRMAELGRERGLTLSFETAIGDVSPGDILQFSSKADIPMCEAWSPNDPHWGGFETKPTAPMVSSAHIYGKPLIAAESFTRAGPAATTWDEHFYTIKHLANLHFAQGINHVVFHTFTHNPFDRKPGTTFGGSIGTPFIRGQTWWKHMPAFTDYIARCHLLLQSGLPVSDVLWYLGDDLDHKPVQHSPFPNGYKFDYLNHDVLVNGLQVKDGNLTINNSTQWRVIWLAKDQCRRMRPETLAKLKSLMEQGATVIGSAPDLNASLSGGTDADHMFEQLVAELWGETAAESGERKIGKGRLLWGGDLLNHLRNLGIHPDVIGTKGATWCHRRTPDKEIYFVAAGRLDPLVANLQFREKGQPFLWDPTTGTKTKLKVYSTTDTHTVIPMNLPAVGAAFITFESAPAQPAFVKVQHNGNVVVDATDLSLTDQGAPFPLFGLKKSDSQQPWIEPQPLPALDPLTGVAWKNGSYQLAAPDGNIETLQVKGAASVPLNGPWTLAFPKGWTANETVTLDSVMPWSELEEEEAKAFSGTAVYKTMAQLGDKLPDERYLLDLGRVDSMVEVVVNGTSAAMLWAPPFRADITDQLKPGKNRIEIKVTNTWFNRLAYDATQKAADRKTWVIGGPKKGATPVPAGLTGPVVLRRGITVDL